MNIGIDARLWDESGVGRYIRNLVGGFEKTASSHTFTIFLNSKEFEYITFKSSRFKKVRADSRWHTLSEQWEFKKILDKEKPDLMHFPYFSFPVFYNKPFVITIHDLIIDHYPTGMASTLPLPMYYLKHMVYKKVLKEGIKNSKKIIVPSYATEQELLDHYKVDEAKIDIIYEGFDPLISSNKKTGRLASQNYILYVGNAYPHKNLPVLLKAFSLLRKKIDDIELICIGRDDFFYQRIEKLPYIGVHFLHNVDDSTLFEYYKHANFFVMPSLMEGFGLPVLEAMSLSCPVICSDTPALKEIGDDAVLYFDAKDPKDLATKMELMLSQPNPVRKLTESGIVRAKSFSWEKCVHETIKVYESCNSI